MNGDEARRAAYDEVVRMCKGGQAWRMSIPANPTRDSDLLIANALDILVAERDRARDLACALEAQLAAVSDIVFNAWHETARDDLVAALLSEYKRRHIASMPEEDA